jgi:hypothetical protein
MLYSLAAIITGEISSKSEIKTQKIRKWNLFWKCQSSGVSIEKNKIRKNIQIFKFGFQYVAKNIEGWSEIFASYLI